MAHHNHHDEAKHAREDLRTELVAFVGALVWLGVVSAISYYLALPSH